MQLSHAFSGRAAQIWFVALRRVVRLISVFGTRAKLTLRITIMVSPSIAPVLAFAFEFGRPAAAARAESALGSSSLTFSAAAPTAFSKSTKMSRWKLFLDVVEKT